MDNSRTPERGFACRGQAGPILGQDFEEDFEVKFQIGCQVLQEAAAPALPGVKSGSYVLAVSQ